jgi:hypothetical protein
MMVKNIVSTLLIVAALGSGTAAFAAPNMGANKDVGIITGLDLKAMTITLADGATYELPYGFNIKSLSMGQRVVVTWDQIGGSELARSVSFSS